MFDPYQILEDPKTGLKIAIIGFTTERGPRVIGHPVVEGLCFTKGDEEIVFATKNGLLNPNIDLFPDDFFICRSLSLV